MKKFVLLVLVSLFSLPLFSQTIKEEYYHYEGLESIVFYKKYDSSTNITLEEGEYHNGFRNGNWYCYHPNGNLNFVFSYENGVKDGKWKQYNEEGKLLSVVVYKRGNRVSKTQYEYYLATQ
jgi:antitoxin component YwqK of YwqJK toxin-antitoxin module